MKISKSASNDMLTASGLGAKIFNAVMKKGENLYFQPISEARIDYCDFAIYYYEYFTGSCYKVANIRIKVWYPTLYKRGGEIHKWFMDDEEIDSLIGIARYMMTDGDATRWRGPLATVMLPIARRGKQRDIPLLMRRLPEVEKTCLKLPRLEYELLEKACHSHLQQRLKQKAKVLGIEINDAGEI